MAFMVNVTDAVPKVVSEVKVHVVREFHVSPPERAHVVTSGVVSVTMVVGIVVETMEVQAFNDKVVKAVGKTTVFKEAQLVNVSVVTFAPVMVKLASEVTEGRLKV